MNQLRVRRKVRVLLQCIRVSLFQVFSSIFEVNKQNFIPGDDALIR